MPNTDEVEAADPNKDAVEDPNKLEIGAEVVGVENRKDDDKDDDVVADCAAEGVLKSDKPPPVEAEIIAAEVCGAFDWPLDAELATNQAF